MGDKYAKIVNSPHKLSNQSTSVIMRDVLIALTPALIAGIIFFGLHALMIVAITILTCVFTEFIYNKLRKKAITIKDFSAVVTGMILGLNLPPDCPIYLAVIGGVFAIFLVKMLFGGIGKNIANPAAAARVFLLLAYLPMATFVIPITNGGGSFTSFGDLASGSTYLAGGMSATTLKSEFLGFTGLRALNLQLFFGSVGGSIGETSALAILIGMAYLLVRRVIDYRIPLTVILASACFAALFSGSINYVLPQLLSGGLLFGAVFMATDYTSSPRSPHGKIVFAIGIGFITMLIRYFGNYPEGMSIAILFMNLLVPLIDKYILPVRFGEKRVSYTKIFNIASIAVMSVVVAVSLLTTTNVYSYQNADILSAQTKGGATTITVKGYVDPDNKAEEGYEDGSVTLKVTIKNKVITSVEYVSHKLVRVSDTHTDEALQEDYFAKLKGSLNEVDSLASGPTTVYTVAAVKNAIDGAWNWYDETVLGGRA